MARQNVVSSAEVGFNMTPMIDCTFQLIIFFILTGQVANDAYAKDVDISRPKDSMAIPSAVAKFPNKVTVNVVSAEAGKERFDPMRASQLGFYKIGTVKYDRGATERMTEVIRGKKEEYEKAFGITPGKGKEKNMFFLEVRADQRVNWSEVAPVIRCGVLAGISKMNITALTAVQ